MCPPPCRCTPRLPTRAEQVAEVAKRYLAILRRTRPEQPPDPAVELVVERTRRRLDQIHGVGRRYLPDAPTLGTQPLSADTITRTVRVRRNDDGPAS